MDQPHPNMAVHVSMHSYVAGSFFLLDPTANQSKYRGHMQVHRLSNSYSIHCTYPVRLSRNTVPSNVGNQRRLTQQFFMVLQCFSGRKGTVYTRPAEDGQYTRNDTNTTVHALDKPVHIISTTGSYTYSVCHPLRRRGGRERGTNGDRRVVGGTTC